MLNCIDFCGPLENQDSPHISCRRFTTTVFYVAGFREHEKSQCEKIVIYRGATLIAGTGAAPQPAMSVMVRGERIEKIERDADFQVPFSSKE